MKTNEDNLIAALLDHRYSHGIRTVPGLASELGLDQADVRKMLGDSTKYEYDQIGDRARLRRNQVLEFSTADRLNRIGQRLTV